MAWRVHRAVCVPVPNLSSLALSPSEPSLPQTHTHTHTRTHTHPYTTLSSESPDTARQKETQGYCCPSQFQKLTKGEDRRRLELKGDFLRGGELPGGAGRMWVGGPDLGPRWQVQAKPWNMPAWPEVPREGCRRGSKRLERFSQCPPTVGWHVNQRFGGPSLLPSSPSACPPRSDPQKEALHSPEHFPSARTAHLCSSRIRLPSPYPFPKTRGSDFSFAFFCVGSKNIFLFCGGGKEGMRGHRRPELPKEILSLP